MMTTWMWILFIVIISQRLVELRIAKSNEKWMKARGGIEKGEEHYKLFIFLHILFFISILAEVYVKGTEHQTLNLFIFTVFVMLQLSRIWCIYSLGRFWNTKIITIPRVALIKKGPYKYVKHPNYIIVGLELFFIPMLFGTYVTAIIFPILHVLLLMIRIPKEEKALTKATLS